MLRVTADTNIIISGLNFRRGKPNEFLQLARAGKISLYLSRAIIDENAGVLARKFHWPAEDIAEVRESLEEMARIVEPTVRLDVIKDAPDNRILECAVASGADYIVSGDNHLLKLDFLIALQEEK